jgi:hypothetical protein
MATFPVLRIFMSIGITFVLSSILPLLFLVTMCLVAGVSTNDPTPTLSRRGEAPSWDYKSLCTPTPPGIEESICRLGWYKAGGKNTLEVSWFDSKCVESNLEHNVQEDGAHSFRTELKKRVVVELGTARSPRTELPKLYTGRTLYEDTISQNTTCWVDPADSNSGTEGTRFCLIPFPCYE